MAETVKPARAIQVAPGGLPFLEFTDTNSYTSPAKRMDEIFANLTSEELELLAKSRRMFGSGRKVLMEAIEAQRAANEMITSMPTEALEILLESGHEYTAVTLKEPIYLTPEKCFTNSASVAHTFPDTYVYVEGLVQPPTGWVVHHAWNGIRAEKEPTALDYTWARADLMLYFGIAFSQEVFNELERISGGYKGGFLHKKLWSSEIKRVLLENRPRI